MRIENLNNPIFSYYNINSLRNKIIDIKEIVSKTLPDVLVLAETKIDKNYKDAQFFIEKYYQPTRKDFTATSGGLIEYVRNGIIRKRKPEFELKHFESIASEFTFNKQKWLSLSFYRTERNENKSENIQKFFQNLNEILEEASKKYDNFILMGDINIDIDSKNTIGYTKLKNFMDLHNLKNLIKEKTCFFKDHKSSIDVILTNKPRRFFKSQCYELGISDCHTMVSTCLRSQVARLKPKTLTYRSMKNYEKDKFLKELEYELSSLTFLDVNQSYNDLIYKLTKLLDKHAPLKHKKMRGNQAKFMNKKLSKAIMKRSSLKTKYLKNKTLLNRTNYKKQRNLCVKLKAEAINNDFEKATDGLNKDSKHFYDLIKPYMTNKGALSSNDIILYENNDFISDDKKLGEIFIDLYTNIVKYTTGKCPKDITSTLDSGASIETVIDKIVDFYKFHPSVKSIREQFSQMECFDFKEVNENGIKEIIKSLNSKKSIGIDNISPQIIKDAVDIIYKPLTKIINLSIKEGTFPTKAKIAAVLPFFKKGDRSNKINYRPVSVLSSLSKVFERVIQNQLNNFIEVKLPPYVSAYRKNYSCQHVLIRLLEEWREGIDLGKHVGAILMDLSKAFDCIPHDLLVAKLNAYGINTSSCKLLYSYLKGRRQCVKINGEQSRYLTLLAGVPQGSILGPLLFNTFINDFTFVIKNTNLHGFADDHTLSTAKNTIEETISTLSNDANIAIDWLNNNDMVANPSKFQAILPSKTRNLTSESFKIKDKTIQSTNEVEILGVVMDENLKFEKHISNLCQSASGQLHSIIRLNRYLKPVAKKLAINSFVLSNFSYCPLVWNFSSSILLNKIEKIQEKALRLITNDKGLSYNDLLKKHNKFSIKTRSLKILATEIFKTINNLNPIYMKDIFKVKTGQKNTRQNLNLKSQDYKTKKFGFRSLRVLGTLLWNSLPNEITNLDQISQFKYFLKNWGKEHCPNYKRFINYFDAIK